MIFKDYYNARADTLDNEFKGYRFKHQNSSDIGELAEKLVQRFLKESLTSSFKVYRGGNIVDIEGNKSKQLDVIICGNNSITIFEDKGLYPVETVYGVFSVTSNLDSKKLKNCIAEFCSIPKTVPQLEVAMLGLDNVRVIEEWQEHFPYKCVFGFTGSLNQLDVTYLNNLVADDPSLKKTLPDLIVINKKMQIQKTNPETELIGGVKTNSHFHLTDFENAAKGQYWTPFVHMMNKLFIYGGWQNKVNIKYHEYFNRELENAFREKT